MPEAFIYDHMRTPRGRGKKDGSLHEVPAVRLAAHTLTSLEERNGLKSSTIDDVILGCVDPVGEAGSDIARAAVFEAATTLRCQACRSTVSVLQGLTRSIWRRVKFRLELMILSSPRGRIHESRRHRCFRRCMAYGSFDCRSLVFHAARSIGRSDRHKIWIFPR